MRTSPTLPCEARKLSVSGSGQGAPSMAGDDEDAKATVTHLLDQFGFDTVDAGPLKEGWRIIHAHESTVEK